MQTVQISDDVAAQLYELAEQKQIPAAKFMEQLVRAHKAKMTKRNELKAFFKPYQRNMAGFQFNREAANER